MTDRPSLPREILALLLGYAIYELYMAMRPDNITDQIREWMETSRGKFAAYYAERQRPRFADAPRDDE